MKSSKKPSTSKLVARFDEELKNLLMEDLRSLRERNQFKNIQKVAAQRTLSAA